MTTVMRMHTEIHTDTHREPLRHTDTNTRTDTHRIDRQTRMQLNRMAEQTGRHTDLSLRSPDTSTPTALKSVLFIDGQTDNQDKQADGD